MRNWLIRKLGGVPYPKEGIALLVYEDQEGPIVAHVEGGRYEMIDYLGGVPLPKPGEGQIVVGPCVKRLPVRKTKVPDNPLNIISEQDLTDAGCPVYTGSAPSSTLPPAGQAIKDAIEAAGGEVHVTEMKMTPLEFESPDPSNLCNACLASVQDCRKAIKETDSGNNTTGCDQHK